MAAAHACFEQMACTQSSRDLTGQSLALIITTDYSALFILLKFAHLTAAVVAPMAPALGVQLAQVVRCDGINQSSANGSPLRQFRVRD